MEAGNNTFICDASHIINVRDLPPINRREMHDG